MDHVSPLNILKLVIGVNVEHGPCMKEGYDSIAELAVWWLNVRQCED